MDEKLKEKLLIRMETLNLKDVQNDILVIRFPKTLATNEVSELYKTFGSILEDMDKKFRVMFLHEDIEICKTCPNAVELLKQATEVKVQEELVYGKKD
jgi:hypothetical protein